MVTMTPQTLQVHRVPAALLRARTRSDNPSTDGWATRVVRLLHATVPHPWDNPGVWPRCQQFLPHVLAATESSTALDQAAEDVAWLLLLAAGLRFSLDAPTKFAGECGS